MDKIKRFSAAVIAMSLACTMMASCGGSDDSSSSNGGSASKADTSSAAAESKEDASSAEDTAASEGGEESGDTSEDASAGVDAADITPDPNYVHNYNFQGYDAFLMFADRSGWFWRNMMHEGSVYDTENFDVTDGETYGYGVDADIVGDGEYTVSITKDSIAQNNGVLNPQALINEDDGTIFAAEGCCVFCVDIVGICNGDFGSGKNEETGEWEMDQELKTNPLDDKLDNHWNIDAKGDYKPSDLKVKVTSIKCDGVEIDFDESKFFYGNIEATNNRYRIEIYNDYGFTATDPGVDPMGLTFNKSLEVTFTIEGLGEVKTFPEVTPFTPGA